MPKKSSSSSSRPRRGRPVRAAAVRAGARGGRGRAASGQRKASVVEKEGNSTALYAVVVSIVVVGLFLGTLLIILISRLGDDSPSAANDQVAAQDTEQITVEELLGAVQSGEQILLEDANNIPIRLDLAHTYLDLAGGGHQAPIGLEAVTQEQVDGYLVSSRQHYELVLVGDPNNSDAHTHLGTVEFIQSRDIAKAVESYDKAIELANADPNVNALHALWDKASLYTRVEMFSEAAVAWTAVANAPEAAGTQDQITAQNFAAQMTTAAESATTTADAFGAGE